MAVLTVCECMGCGYVKSRWEFPYKPNGKPTSQCRECTAIRQRTHSNYHLKMALHTRRRHAAKAGVPFSITVEDLLPVPTHCPMLGLELRTGVGKPTENSPSIDRIIPELGYVPGNVMIISYRANRIKNDATHGELRAIADYLESVANPYRMDQREKG